VLKPEKETNSKVSRLGFMKKISFFTYLCRLILNENSGIKITAASLFVNPAPFSLRNPRS